LVVTFDDEFSHFDRWRDGKGVWRTTFRDGKADDEYEVRTLRWNKELELYVDPETRPHAVGPGPGLGINPFTVSDGALTITTDRAPADLVPQLGGFRYVSGLISTQPSFSQTYGYFEMRAKLPRGKGIWPAFWLLPTDFDWPPEIDVMESIGDPSKVYVTAHSKTVKDGGLEVTVSPDDFHTYAVSWDQDKLVWFVDGREVKRLATPADMHKPMYLLANVAVGGDWAGTPDATTPFPTRYVIDYIRAYRFAR
jgi:beta-glucanase (GH16 family)